MIIEIPNWCVIGKCIEWHNPRTTGFDWVTERIVAYGYDGFFHESDNSPMYYSKFSEYGKTIREIDDTRRSDAYWIPLGRGMGYICSACSRFTTEKKEYCNCGCNMMD